MLLHTYTPEPTKHLVQLECEPLESRIRRNLEGKEPGEGIDSRFGDLILKLTIHISSIYLILNLNWLEKQRKLTTYQQNNFNILKSFLKFNSTM